MVGPYASEKRICYSIGLLNRSSRVRIVPDHPVNYHPLSVSTAHLLQVFFQA